MTLLLSTNSKSTVLSSYLHLLEQSPLEGQERLAPNCSDREMLLSAIFSLMPSSFILIFWAWGPHVSTPTSPPGPEPHLAWSHLYNLSLQPLPVL